MAVVTREKEMDVPIEALYAAITRFEDYPKFLPEVVSAKVLPGATPELARVQFEIEVVKRFDYTLEWQMKPGREAKWKLVESNFFKTNSGKWSLTAKDAAHTAVQYQLDVSFGFLVPGWISRKLTEVSLPKMFENFEKEWFVKWNELHIHKS